MTATPHELSTVSSHAVTYSPAATTNNKDCRQGWIKSKTRPSKCYFIDKKPQVRRFEKSFPQVYGTFEGAVEFCSTIGGELLGIANEFENSEIRGEQFTKKILQLFLGLISGTPQLSMWLGLRRKNGAFHWANNEISDYRHWRFNREPPFEDCARVDRSGYWVGLPCRTSDGPQPKLPVICQQYV